ncbi:MAG TPA: single-stranded-DNA-specific exonuclease RecJ, partial [Rhodanobacteraceae bacterium]|nr:single-stranded-DNA-specific exonuclease RecJ [Rhodanobacteraceae bacterium]
MTTAWPAGVPAALQRVYAARGVTDAGDVEHRLARLLPPQALGGLDAAVTLLADAIAADADILIAGDYDCDGATGVAVGVRGLRLLGALRVRYAVPHRRVHGYGLTPALVASLTPLPDLIVTVDNGIASHAGIAAARAGGVRVIVTDHHLPGPTLPEADAIVNPNLPGDAFPSKALAGVGVMFYLLLALRAGLRERGTWAAQGEPDLAELLDRVALGTVADLVPLDYNNRVLVESGLRRIRGGRACAGIGALIDIAGRRAATLTATDLGFALAPRINAAGRMEDMRLGIECLLSDDPDTARAQAARLQAINAERREVQALMVADAQVMTAVDAIGSGVAGAPWGLSLVAPGGLPLGVGVALFDPAWHAGVVGLVASKLKESLHRPVVAFAPAGDGSDELRGSARSIPGFHVRDALAAVDARHPGLILRFGGHAMAAGLSLRTVDFARFAQAFDAVARGLLSDEALQPVLWTDGELQDGEFSLELARALRDGGPWGQGFPEPLFDNVFERVAWRPLGEGHWRLTLRATDGGGTLEAVMFNAGPAAPPARLRAAYQL